MGVLDTLNAASVGRVSVPLIVDQALDARWDELNTQLAAAAKADHDAGSLALPATTKVVDQMEEIRTQVEASQVTFDFEPLDWPQRLAMQADHPPRANVAADQLRGYNIETFIPALIKAACVKVTSADGDEATDIPDSTWAHLLGNPDAKPPVKASLAPGQVSQLFAAATNVNQGVDRVPPSARSLLGIQDSGASLAQPSPGKAPRRSGSAGGSRRGSRSTSTTTQEGSSGA